MVFDYLIMYKIDEGFKPIIVKNGNCQGRCYKKWFEDYYEELSEDEANNGFYKFEKYYEDPDIHELNKDKEYQFIKEFEDKYFGHADYKVDALLEFVCEIYREKLYKFLEEKYNVIKQDVLLF